MRITISTDDKGKVNIDTGEAGDVRPGLFESTSDVPVIDAGAAPIQEIERMQKVAAGVEVGKGLQATAAPSPEERDKESPLNPLRAGAEAAYRDPANLRKRAADAEGTFAVAQQQREPQAQQQPSGATNDGGAAPAAERKEAPGASKREPRSKQQTSKRDRKR